MDDPRSSELVDLQDDASTGLDARLARRDGALRRSAAAAQRADGIRRRSEAAQQRTDAAHERARRARQQARDAIEEFDGTVGREVVEDVHTAAVSEVDAEERQLIAGQLEADQFEADQLEASANERDDTLRRWDAEVTKFARQAKHDARRWAARATERERLLGLWHAELEEPELSDGSDHATVSLRLRRASSHAESSTLMATHLSNWAARLRDETAELADLMAWEAEQFAKYLEKSSACDDQARRLNIAKAEREVARIERDNAARLRDTRKRYKRAEPLPSLFGRHFVAEEPTG